MICSVAVVSNNIKAVCTCFLSFVNSVGIIYKGLPPESSCKRPFFVHNIPQGGIANGLHGLNPRNTAHGTPPCKRRPALVWRLVKQLVHGGNKASCISEQTRHANLGFIVNNIKLGAGRIPLYPPLVDLCQENSKGEINGN